MAKQPDILVFMSDQHGADYTGRGNLPVDTPVLDEMRENGCAFDAAYTSCPLCVPARMSMMSALLPSRTGIFGNADTLPDMTPCFTHALVAAGYETVLIGRMHFIGRDQRHGFTKRLAPDITPVSWSRPFKQIQEEHGLLQYTTHDAGAVDIVGGGESFVKHYDRMVVDRALDYLRQPHEKPQFILVGTYGPHFPYITNAELYRKYLERVQLPAFFAAGTQPDYMQSVEALRLKMKDEEVDETNALGCLAAYLGQIEVMDGQIGEVRRAFAAYAAQAGHESVFAYVSDHGDTAGERRVYGKRTFFDKSAKVPMLFEGSGIPKGKIVSSPVSLMDLGPTVCALADTEFEIGDGRALTGFFADIDQDDERIVVSQFVDNDPDTPQAAVMLRWRQYKYMQYHDAAGSRLLFDLDADPLEAHDLSGMLPELTERFAAIVREQTDFAGMERQFAEHKRNAKWFTQYEKQAGFDGSERWSGNPPTARGDLEIKTVYRIRQPDFSKFIK